MQTEAKKDDDHILSEDLYQVAIEVASCPTAPGFEDHVQALILKRLAALPHVMARQDEFGNIIAVYDFASDCREPIRFVAHMDHPAFVVEPFTQVSLTEEEKAPLDRKGGLFFRGGIHQDYLVGSTIRFHARNDVAPLGEAVITALKVLADKQRADAKMRVEIASEIPPHTEFAVWALPPASCTKRTRLAPLTSQAEGAQVGEAVVQLTQPMANPGDALFLSPACDDLVQVATLLALLTRLAQGGYGACVHALFTRSEETGFYGALAALESHIELPKMVTISLETSHGKGMATVGGGPIVRVGDRLTVFDSRVTYWMEKSFQDWYQKLDRAKFGHRYLPFQRKLMSGGACEGTVFSMAGFPTGALCLAMFNYHNMGPDKQVDRESVSLRDWQSLYEGLFYLATESAPIGETWQALQEQLNQRKQEALKALR